MGSLGEGRKVVNDVRSMDLFGRVVRKKENGNMNNKLKMRYVTSLTVQVLLAFIALQFPMIGYCDSGSGFFTGWFESKGKNMKEVATKIATLNEEDYIWGLDFSADGKHLAATPFGPATVHIWDWQGNRLERILERVKGSKLNNEPVRYSPDGKLLAICHSNGAGSVVARIWNTDTWNVVHDIDEPVRGECNAIGFTSDGKLLIRVSQHSESNLSIYDVATWQAVWGINTQSFVPSTLAISPDNKLVAIGGVLYSPSLPVSMQTQIAIVDLAQRKIVRTTPIDNTADVGRLAWNPDGASYAYGYAGGVAIFDMQTGTRAIDEATEQKRKALIRYTPDGKYFIESGFGTGGARIRIWDGQHRELLQEISGDINSLAISRDGHYLAAGSFKTITVWQLK
jgi:WD40 repeat protein